MAASEGWHSEHLPRISSELALTPLITQRVTPVNVTVI